MIPIGCGAGSPTLVRVRNSYQRDGRRCGLCALAPRQCGYPNRAALTRRATAAAAASWVANITAAELPPARRPLECVQGPGEVMYLPAGWPHLTINLGGLTVGAGGQEDFDFNDRQVRAAELPHSRWDLHGAPRGGGEARALTPSGVRRFSAAPH